MKNQDFKNHGKYVPGFHILAFGIIVIALIISLILFVHTGVTHETALYVLFSLALVLLFWYCRSFATANQDRIIRAEENFRCYVLTGKQLDSRLTRNQIIALRFAEDEEYLSLSERAVKENLSPKEIKQAISKWKADHHRV